MRANPKKNLILDRNLDKRLKMWNKKQRKKLSNLSKRGSCKNKVKNNELISRKWDYLNIFALNILSL